MDYSIQTEIEQLVEEKLAEFDLDRKPLIIDSMSQLDRPLIHSTAMALALDGLPGGVHAEPMRVDMTYKRAMIEAIESSQYPYRKHRSGGMSMNMIYDDIWETSRRMQLEELNVETAPAGMSDNHHRRVMNFNKNKGRKRW